MKSVEPWLAGHPSAPGHPWHRVNITHFHWTSVPVCVCECVKTHILHLQPAALVMCAKYILNEIFRHVQ